MPTLDPLARQHWTLPIPIHYGPGARDALPGLCRQHGMARPLLVTDRGSRTLPFVAELLGAMTAAGLAPTLFAEIEPNPTDRAIAFPCPGVPVTACASMRPLASKTPADRSPHSRTIEEKAVRSSVCAVQLQQSC